MNYTVRQVKKVFKKHSHIGRYWGIKPRYNIFTGNVSIKLRRCESFVYNMRTGRGKRLDLDDDGCSVTNDFGFTIGPSKRKNQLGELTILRDKI